MVLNWEFVNVLLSIRGHSNVQRDQLSGYLRKYIQHLQSTQQIGQGRNFAVPQ